MKLEEKKQCLEFLGKLKALDFEKIILNHFSPKDLEITLIGGEYPIREFIKILRKLIENFQRELDANTWPSLSAYSSQDEKIRLKIDLQELHQHISSNTFSYYLSEVVNRLVAYQRRFNFWNNIPSVSQTEIENLANQLRQRKDMYDSLVSEQANKNIEIENRLNLLLETIQEKSKEFQKLMDNITESSDIIHTIRETSIEGKNQKEKLNEIVNSSKQNADEAKNRIEEERKKFEDYRKEKDDVLKMLLEKIDETNGIHKHWAEKFSSIEEKEKYIEAKQKEINNLTSFAAGVSLFHTFQERKKELHKSVNFWRYAVVGIAAIVLGILIVLFYINPSTTANGTSWGIFALNSVKSLPAIILLYFAIRQYNKERSFQEEYAFKSSVALTINAYADKLTQEGNTGKDNLIISSVAKVYETPGAMREKGTVISFRNKSFNETMKNLTEVLKEIKK